MLEGRTRVPTVPPGCSDNDPDALWRYVASVLRGPGLLSDIGQSPKHLVITTQFLNKHNPAVVLTVSIFAFAAASGFW